MTVQRIGHAVVGSQLRPRTSETPLRHGGHMERAPMTASAQRWRQRPWCTGPRHSRVRALDPGRIVSLWWCPVCGAAAHRTARPGRPRVYCTNACRQRAYRVRRQARATLPVRTRPQSLVRARSRGRSHALRPPDVFPAGPPDGSGRELSLCGAFVRRDTVPPWVHDHFVPEVPWACGSCVVLGP